MRSSRRAFTLLELLVVILLLGVAFGAVSIKIPKLLENERFEKNVSAIVDTLTMAQELMLDYRIDVDVKFAGGENGKIVCALSSPYNLPESAKRIMKDKISLTSVERISGPVLLHFDGVSFATPSGPLTIEGKHKSTTLNLLGYPSRIVREETTHVHQKNTSYPEEIVSAL